MKKNRAYIFTAIIIILITVGWGYLFVSSYNRHQEHQEDLRQAIYDNGYEWGYNRGLVEMHVLKESAIRAGVAKYVIADKVTGDTALKWVTADGLKEIYIMEHEDYPVVPVIDEVETYTE